MFYNTDMILRSTLATFIGLIVAVIVVQLIELLGHLVYPVPDGLDVYDPEALAAFVETLPPGALLFVLAAWFIGTLTGGLVAAVLGPDARPARPARRTWVVTAVLFGFTAANLAAIPHPPWFTLAALLLVPVAGLLAAWRAPRAKPAGD